MVKYNGKLHMVRYNGKLHTCMYHPHHEMTGVNQDHVKGFLMKQEFTSTHIQTININVLNVKLLQV
jgi:hypothetical protein